MCILLFVPCALHNIVCYVTAGHTFVSFYILCVSYVVVLCACVHHFIDFSV